MIDPHAGSCSRQDPRIAFFDGHAPTWDRTGPDPERTLRRLDELKGRLSLRPGMDLLEVGCGTGQITGWLSGLVCPGRVMAVDFSPAMLRKARERKIRAEFALLDICLEGPPLGQFDALLCFSSFPHFRDPAAALRQIRRHLKPGGCLTVLHLAGRNQLNAFHHQVGGAVGQDVLPPAGQWPKLLEEAKLRLTLAEDQPDLFLVQAEPLPDGGSGT